MSKPRHVVLMGLMGSGKSTIGVPLARRLGRPYVDNDRQLELRTGQTAHALAAAVGMDELHRDEAATLLDSLARDEPAVIGAPASAITERAIRERLGDEFVVWLDPPIDDLVARFHRQNNRPSMGDDLGAVLAAAVRRARAAVPPDRPAGGASGRRDRRATARGADRDRGDRRRGRFRGRAPVACTDARSR